MTVRELLKFLMSHPDELDRDVVVVTGDEPVTTSVAVAYFASWVDDAAVPQCIEPGVMYLVLTDEEQ